MSRNPGQRYAAALLLLCLAAPARAGSKLTGDPVMIPRNAGGSGGQRLETGALVLNNTVGEVGVQPAAGGSLKLERGLMSLAAQPGSVVSITAVTKATGALDLSWSAPGLDGFQGSVVNGFYRVDFSTDPAHAFSPTEFQLEFSTSVTPGEPQSLELVGLVPNTTYYTRIYLADDRKFFAEDSARSDESTLADAPVSPTVVSVSSNEVTLSWQVPSSGSEGYQAQADPALGGSTVSSGTPNGLTLQLTVTGLSPNTTYFFKVASLNWQGDRNFGATVLTAVTRSSRQPLAVTGLSPLVDPLRRTVTLTWATPFFIDQTGVIVLVSTSPVSTEVQDGVPVALGQTLADGSVVKSTAVAEIFQESGLSLDTTRFYHVYTQGLGPLYSLRVSTSVFLDLPPMAPAALAAASSADRSRVTVSWRPVKSSADGTPFLAPAAPQGFELARYEIHRATGALGAAYVKIATLPLTSLSYTDAVPDPNSRYFYKVLAIDSLSSFDAPMAVEPNGDLYAFTPDLTAVMRVPAAFVPELKSTFNPFGADILLRASEEPADGTDKVFRSVRFDAVQAPTAEIARQFQFSRPEARVALAYDVSGGLVVPSRPSVRPASFPAVSVAQASTNLGMYWYNGEKFIKLFGKVDSGAQTVAVQSAQTGSYQIRGMVRELGFSFDLSSRSNKVITPNGDGLNDAAVFQFDNPKDSAFSGRVFDVTGAAVADMTPGPVRDSLQWDGKADGRPVSGGVYVYQIRAEEKAFTGTLLVIR